MYVSLFSLDLFPANKTYILFIKRYFCLIEMYLYLYDLTNGFDEILLLDINYQALIMSNRLRLRLFFLFKFKQVKGFRNFANVTLIILALMYWFNYNRNKYLRTLKTHKLHISKITRFDDHCFYRLPWKAEGLYLCIMVHFSLNRIVNFLMVSFTFRLIIFLLPLIILQPMLGFLQV